jgi:hypothetical protein
MNGEAKKPRKKKTQTFVDTAMGVVRAELERTESRLWSTERDLAARENEHARLERRTNAAEAEATALLDAIRILASGIPPDTAQGRRIRQEARQLLESKKISPPSTLGSSRNRGKKRS